MKIGIMQPYIFPYIGYFQLINAVDKFVVYDDIQYTKKGWINRNRMLQNGKDLLFSIPLKKGSDFLNVNERELAENFFENNEKLKRQIISAYSKAPFFKNSFPVIEDCLSGKIENLFDFIHYSLQQLCGYLDIKTPIIISSSLQIDKQCKGEEMVININKQLQATTYINAIGGQLLYNKETFLNNGIELKFIKTDPIIYTQFKNEFVSNLSIIDVMMFNSPQQVNEYLSAYSLV